LTEHLDDRSGHGVAGFVEEVTGNDTASREGDVHLLHRLPIADHDRPT
jgi:hypothetical protein